MAKRTSTEPRDLSSRILVGLTLGIALGLLIGERAAVLQVGADVYIKLLQMTVLPYITVSLVGGLGALNAASARKLGWAVALVLLGLWATALAAVFTFPWMFPRTESASFFSTTLLEDRTPLDLVELYIPANPFHSLANNIVPAVVLFSVLLGIALMGLPGKDRALGVIDVLNAAVSRVARYIVWLTPYGLFAIAAVTAGTFDPAQAAQIEVYLVSYVVISLVLALWVLPGLVAALTPVPHRAFLARTRTALLMAFSTGSLFVVLPLLTDQARQLLDEYTDVTPDLERLPDVIIPASFNFPHTAKILTLSFVVFAAWFAGASLPRSDYPALAVTGVMVLFGNVSVAVPFLLDTFRIPADTFQLFLATSVVNARFGTMLSAVHTVTMALVGACVVMGVARFDVRKLLRFAAITLVISGTAIVTTRVVLTRIVPQAYTKDAVLRGMQGVRDRGTAQVFTTPPPLLPAIRGSVLERIRSRQALRVGYFDDSLPYAFRNASGDLVGFDVEMALQLARDLNVRLELVPASRRLFDEGLDPSACDLVMSGTAVTADRAVRVLFSTSYLDETMAFIVLDHRRDEFASWDDLRAARALRLGIPAAPYYMRKIRAELPSATLVVFESPDQMFRPHDPPLDAMILTAERGSAYTLLHPEYSVMVPRPRLLRVPLAYVVAGKDEALASVLNTWIDLKRKDGTIDELFAHWILGRDATPRHRRWSVVDDVLHWAK